MATLDGLVDDVYEIVYGVARVERPAEDTLDTTITAGAVSLIPDTPTMWSRNDYAEFADGDVVIFAEDGDAGGSAVRRSQRGSTAASHNAGDVMRKNPWPLRVTIEDKINEAIRNDCRKLWSWFRGSVTFTTGDHLYDLDEHIVDVVAVEQANVDSDGKFRPLPPSHWDVERQVHTDIAANNLLLRLRGPYDDDTDVYYRAKRRPHPDDLGNLDAELEPIIAWFAAGKLFAGGVGGTIQDTARRGRNDPNRNVTAYQLAMSEAQRLRREYAIDLGLEVPRERRYRPKRKRTW